MSRLIARILSSALIVLIFSPYIWYWYERANALMSGAKSDSANFLVTIFVGILAVSTWLILRSAIENAVTVLDESGRKTSKPTRPFS